MSEAMPSARVPLLCLGLLAVAPACRHKPPASCDAQNLPRCEDACHDGSLETCVLAGNALLGRPGPIDVRPAVELYVYACEGGFARGCTSAANALRYRADERVPDAMQRYAALLTRGCDLGEGHACFQLAGDDPASRARLCERAATIFLASCDQGDYGDCADLGVLYISGLCEPFDLARASALFQLACTHGDATSCGVLQDIAMERQACDAGSRMACGMFHLPPPPH